MESNTDITALTETWLKTDGQNQNIVEKLKPKFYELPNEPRGTGHGGGVGVLHKRQVKLKPQKLAKFVSLNTQKCVSHHYFRPIFQFIIPLQISGISSRLSV